MTYLPHRWVATDSDAQCQVCGIWEWQFDAISRLNPMPTCTFGDEWHHAQPDAIPQSAIDGVMGGGLE